MAVRRAPERRYVEDELGLHGLHAEATELAKNVEYNMEQAAKVRMSIYEMDSNIEYRELELRQMLREATEFKSLAAEDRAFQEAKLKDEKYVQRVQLRAETQQELANVEAGLRGCELAHRSVVARMNNLTAYVTFLAACKSARTAALDVQIPV